MNVLCSSSGSEEDTFVFPQSDETEHNKGPSDWKNNTGDSALSDRSTQTDPGVWTPEKKERRVCNHISPVHASLERQVRHRLGAGPLAELSHHLFFHGWVLCLSERRMFFTRIVSPVFYRSTRCHRDLEAAPFLFLSCRRSWRSCISTKTRAESQIDHQQLPTWTNPPDTTCLTNVSDW